MCLGWTGIDGQWTRNFSASPCSWVCFFMFEKHYITHLYLSIGVFLMTHERGDYLLTTVIELVLYLAIQRYVLFLFPRKLL
jgi:hypothetical protein